MTAPYDNPFLATPPTPHGALPLPSIRLEHYEPAIMEGIRRHDEEIRLITACADSPTFDNTIAALDYSGQLLEQVSTVLMNLNEAETSDEMQELVMHLTPILTEHSNNVTLNDALFKRIEAVHQTADRSRLSQAQLRLLDDTNNALVSHWIRANRAGVIFCPRAAN